MIGYRLRDVPEDFRVEEIPAYLPSGEGEHTFVRVEKRLRTTSQVAGLLSRAAGCASRDVGYAGRKDRVAVTTQWFSVPGFDPEAALALDAEGVRVLAASRHGHKLRTGQLRGNRFELVVRGVSAEAVATAAERLEACVMRGFPNAFGDQRFGVAGDNAERAAALLAGERIQGDRRAARFLVSALQSAVFNHVLENRKLPLGAIEAGDVAMRHESGGVFDVEDAVVEGPRADAFEISATGPMFGTKMRRAQLAPGMREEASFREFGIDIDALRVPRGLRLRGTRRPLRVRPSESSLAIEGDVLRLGFCLPPGSYATVLVEHLLGPQES